MKTWIKSLGEAIRVAKAKESGWTVGKVDIAALLNEYGSGQKRIMQRILSPSCFSVNANASNRLSSPTRRCTYFERTVREARNEQRDPTTVADPTMNHPFGKP